MKNTLKITLAIALALFLLTGCGFTRTNADASGEAVVTAGAATLSVEVDAAVSDRDAAGEYDAAEAVSLDATGDLTITEAGVYLLSGRYEGMILIEAGEEDKVQLVLQNAELSNENGPAIYIRSADKVFLTAAEGTVNTISDGADYSLTDGETSLDAAVFSKADLTINGAGALTITGNYKHAVVSKDDLVVTAKALTVNAANVGLDGKDAVKLSEATVSITAGSDGIRSENSAEEDRGYISIVDSSVAIVSGKDGIQAETAFYAENANLVITAGGGSGVRSGTESCKGIKAGASVVIDGGSFQIDAADDAIHANGSVSISGGSFTLQSGDDGIHANELAEISGGTLNITAYEGIEATYIRISGGEITIAASDDGINAARKSSAYTPTVEITGGTVTITMGQGDTDGIDSNGTIIITGGTVSVYANSPFDYDGTATFTGGTVYVNGQQVTTLPNQMMGGGMGGFGGGPGGGPGGQGGFGGGYGGQGGGPGGRR